jgi:hypothetical protein
MRSAEALRSASHQYRFLARIFAVPPNAQCGGAAA